MVYYKRLIHSLEGCDSTIELLPLSFYYHSNSKPFARGASFADFIKRPPCALISGNTFGIRLSRMGAARRHTFGNLPK